MGSDQLIPYLVNFKCDRLGEKVPTLNASNNYMLCCHVFRGLLHSNFGTSSRKIARRISTMLLGWVRYPHVVLSNAGIRIWWRGMPIFRFPYATDLFLLIRVSHATVTRMNISSTGPPSVRPSSSTPFAFIHENFHCLQHPVFLEVEHLLWD